MPANPDNPQINTRVYDFCVRAFRTTKKLLKLNIKLHQEGSGEDDPVHQGDIFLFNHFSRFETFIPQYMLYEHTGVIARAIASGEFFGEGDMLGRYLAQVGAVPNDVDDLLPFLAIEMV